VFRTLTFITACLVSALISAATATPPIAPNENISSIAASAQTKDREVAEIIDLQRFTNIAYIPEDADLSSIRIKGVKAVKILVKRRSVINPRYCGQRWSDPGGSMYCPSTTDESRVPAYRVKYSFQAQPMASDEYANKRFTFSVYFRPDEFSPELRRALSTSTFHKSAAGELFNLTTWRDSAQQIVIDQPKSVFCDGNYVEGNWVRKNPKCIDRIALRTVMSPSPYTAVRIDLAPSRLEKAAAEIRSWQK